MMTKLRSIYGLLIVMFLFSFNATGQKDNYEKGTIILNKKKNIEAYISIDFRFPQQFQTLITYISVEDYEKFQQTGNLKKKSKKSIKPKDVVGFDLEEGTTFRTIEYMDLSESGTIGMIPKKLCLEKRIEGKIDVYKLYSHTTGKISDELAKVILDSQTEGDDHLIDYIENNFQLLVQKDSDNPKNLMAINLLNYIGDNDQVKQNYTKNHYGFRDGFTDDGEGIVSKKLETSFLRLLKDYDTASSGQLSK